MTGALIVAAGLTLAAPAETDAYHEWDVLFLGDAGPVRARLQLEVEGDSLKHRWEARVRAVFDHFDRDGDGFLDESELRRVFTADGVKRLTHGGTYFRSPAEPLPMADVDRDGDGKVSPEELARYYAPSAAETLVTPVPGRSHGGAGERLTAAIFRRLDRDRDGRLDEREVAALPGLVASLDRNQDECLTALELAPEMFSAAADGTEMMAGMAGMMAERRVDGPKRPEGEPGLFVTPAGADVSDRSAALFARYDSDGDGRLSRQELGLDAARFARLDADGDGVATAEEVAAWLGTPPASEVRLTLSTDDGRTAAEVIRPAEDGGRDPRQVTLRDGAQRLQLGVPGPLVREAGADMSSYGSAFNGLPVGGSVRISELAGPSNQLLRIVFDGADRDGDGMLTREELEAYLALKDGFRTLQLGLRYTVVRPSLFEMMDADGDGRLSPRELRGGWENLRPLARDGVIEAADLIPVGVVEFGGYDQIARGQVRAPWEVRITPPSDDVPEWFRFMDLNRDGDLSRLEWLGNRESFDRLDADGDGLISVAEARAAEK